MGGTQNPEYQNPDNPDSPKPRQVKPICENSDVKYDLSDIYLVIN